MPYGRCVVYTFTGEIDEVVRTAHAGILPIFQRQHGFIAYGVMPVGDHIVSMSAWDSEADAKGADEAAKDWVSKNLDMTVVHSYMGDYAWLEFAAG